MKHNYNRDYSNIDSFHSPISDKILIFAFSASVAFPAIDSLINRYFKIEFWDSLLTKGLYYCSLLVALYFVGRHIKREMVIIPFLVISLWSISYILFPGNRAALVDSKIITSLATSLSLFIITLAIQDYERLFKAMRVTSIIVVICSLIQLYLQYIGFFDLNYMDFSYSMSISTLFLIIISLRNKRKFDIIMATMGFSMVFISGARGSLIGLILGAFFYIVTNSSFNIKNVSLLLALGLSILLLNAKFFTWFNILNEKLERINITSRTINYLLEKNIADSSGRDNLFRESLAIIKDNFVFGNGMSGDRAFFESYSHNLFTEILIEYGGILGTLFLIFLLRYLVKSLFIKENEELYYIYLAVFFTNGFVKLQFSSSYLLEPMFFMMMALAIKIMKNQGYRLRFRHV